LSRPNTWLRRLLSEPLTHFVVLGAILFVCGRLYQQHVNTYRIDVTPAHVAELARKYQLQFGALPDPQTLEVLIHDDVNDEVLFRQALALKLDQDDEIIRSRLVQKQKFIMQNLHPPAEPTDAQLGAYYAAHADRYSAPPRTTFSHIYFSADQGGDAAAQQRARAALAKLGPGVTRDPDLGDPFPDLYDFSAYEPDQVDRLFGHTPFADAVFTAPVGRWSGPYRSAYGWHLIYVDARTPGGRPPLSAVRDRVRTDFLQDAQDKANTAAFDQLARKFTVVRDDRKPAAK
jgi:peptidyl-prolyl cis-trans isomerase C